MVFKISEVSARVPNSDRFANIKPNGKSLILVGGNGCGKTQFINKLYQALSVRLLQNYVESFASLSGKIKTIENHLKQVQVGSSEYEHNYYRLNELKSELAELAQFDFTQPDAGAFASNYHGRAVLLKFQATRQANIRRAMSAKSESALVQESKGSEESSVFFEEYLVSQKTMQAYAESPSIGNSPDVAVRIKKWFDKLEVDLRELFEDDSLCLIFQHESQSFCISQNGKAPYSFQDLSSGFSSILSIYTELLTKIQLSSVSADEVFGFVFIDEIDAHLHVSLQRKILAFLTRSFPGIQFIVSTHSPFVVSSVSDAVIYDLSSMEQVDDLSLYSYESIVAGLFNTLPVSDVLRNKINELAVMADESKPDLIRLEQLVKEVGGHEDALDVESMFFLKKARISLYKRGGGDSV